MSLVAPSSPRALAAGSLISSLQQRLVDRLRAAAYTRGDDTVFVEHRWLRDEGAHGGGARLGVEDSPTFNRASVNVSAIHYDDLPERRLASANALSSIVHPNHPRAPSVHLHLSWTEMRDGAGYWRLMADLNPSIPDATDTARFAAALHDAAPGLYADAAAQGDRYFEIPALKRHRGVTHFYLEQFNSGDFDADLAFVGRFGRAAIDAYGAILAGVLRDAALPTHEEQSIQLDYHTLYLFQVLTLDRGTTSGLLVHDQNDVGIMGSLPGRVRPGLLARWADAVPPVQAPLVRSLVEALGDAPVATVDEPVKRALAGRVRRFYRDNPAALDLQARGDVVPPTVDNHQ